MKTRKTTVTLTFTLSHTLEDNETDLSAVRAIINQMKDTCEEPMQVYDDEDSNGFNFIMGSSSTLGTGRMFSFTTIGEFVKVRTICSPCSVTMVPSSRARRQLSLKRRNPK